MGCTESWIFEEVSELRVDCYPVAPINLHINHLDLQIFLSHTNHIMGIMGIGIMGTGFI